ncbi:MAG TPA: LapA family protein [Gammaproteobacteria bacterium]|nr:LapA family protein [Gammaproteobacteria bacterium]
MKRLLVFLFILVVVVLGLGFAVLNAESVAVNFYFGTLQAPLSMVVVLAMVVGALLGVAASLKMVLAQRRRAGKLQHQVQLAEQELKNLREIPIKD